jgi:glyoxylate reductase
MLNSAPAMPIVLITRDVPGQPHVPGASLVIAGSTRFERPALLERLRRGVSVLISMFYDKIDVEALDAGRAGQPDGLRGVVNFAVGTDNIDLAACRARGVIVCNTPNAVTEGTADLAWALILAAARHLVPGDAFARSGAWAKDGPLGMGAFCGQHLTGRTLLIVGAGRIGYATALRSIGWGMRVLYTARSQHWDFELAPLAARRVSLEEGLRAADVVSLHCPLTPETRHLIAAPQLALMKPSAILVNTARGPVVDEQALAAALRERRIYAAGLDVFEREPEVHADLKGLDNVVMMPHVGSAAVHYREMMTRMVCENAAAILAGNAPPNRVA